jgi:hypothetical protein
MEILTPCVQDCGDPDIGTKMAGIGRNAGEGLSRGLEQQPIDRGLVLIGDRTDRRRKRENQVKIRNRKKLGFTRRKPCRRSRPLAFRAVAIATAIKRDTCVGTVLAAVDMTTKRGSATNLDCCHDAPLGEVYVLGIGCSPRLAMGTEDIRQFELRPQHFSNLASFPCFPGPRGAAPPDRSGRPRGGELLGRPQPPAPS